jgi:hypothetical protein
LTAAEIYELPASVDIPTASRAIGISPATGYELRRAGEFPITVLPVGRTFKVPLSAILAYLNLPPLPEHPATARAGAA